MTLAEVVTSRHWTAAGLTMMHYLWIGALLGVVSAFIRAWVRPKHPVSRYTAALFCLGMLTAAPFVIYCWALAPPGGTDPSPASSVVNGSGSVGIIPSLVESPTSVPSQQQGVRFGSAQILAIWHSAAAQLDHILPWFWLCGSMFMLAVVFTGMAGTRRLCQETRSLTGTAIELQCRRIAHSLGVARRVLLVVSDRIAAPVVVGIWRPTIILPLAVWTGLQPAQIEMILWHELAHVRRYDNLLNFFERIVQSLLFFQPAIWIVCRWVRLERENCCDAVALCHATSRHAYAETLASLAAPGFRLPTSLASAANHQLIARIRYILHPDENPAPSILRVGPQLAAFGIALACVATVWAERDSERPARSPHRAVDGSGLLPRSSSPAHHGIPTSPRGVSFTPDPASLPEDAEMTAPQSPDNKKRNGGVRAAAVRIVATTPQPETLGNEQVASTHVATAERQRLLATSKSDAATERSIQGNRSAQSISQTTAADEATAATAIRALGGWTYLNTLGFVEEVNLAYRDSAHGRIHNDISSESDAGLRHVSAFSHLKRLSLYRGQATNDALKAVANLKELEVISCWNTKAVTDEGVRSLAELTNLREVYFDVGSLGDGALSVFGGLPKLEVLRMLVGNEITDAGLRSLAGSDNLRELAIGQGKHPLTDSAVEHLLKLKRLEILNLQDSKISALGVEKLKSMPGLKYLRVNASEEYERVDGKWTQIQ